MEEKRIKQLKDSALEGLLEGTKLVKDIAVFLVILFVCSIFLHFCWNDTVSKVFELPNLSIGGASDLILIFCMFAYIWKKFQDD